MKEPSKRIERYQEANGEGSFKEIKMGNNDKDLREVKKSLKNVQAIWLIRGSC